MKQARIPSLISKRFQISYRSTKNNLQLANRLHSPDLETSSIHRVCSYSTFQKSVPVDDFFSSSNEQVTDFDIFSNQDEFTLLRALVNNQLTTKFNGPMANLRQKREHQRLLNNALSNSTENLDFSLALKSSKHNRSRIQKKDTLHKAQEFVSTTDKDLGENEIINFIATHTNSTFTASQLSELLKVMAEFGNQYSLPGLFKAYHKIFNDTNSWPELTSSKQDFLYETLLTRALKIFPKTEYIIEDGCLFEKLGSYELDYLGEIVAKTDGPKVRDLYLRLVANSGSFRSADTLITKFITDGLTISDKSVDSFFISLGNYLAANKSISPITSLEYNTRVKKAIKKYAPCLRSQNITPAIAEFLLEHTSHLEEFYRLLNAIEESQYRDRIMSKCQSMIVKTAARCSLPIPYWAQLENETVDLNTSKKEEVKLAMDYNVPVIRKSEIYAKSMATMFGVLSRLGKSSAGITIEALDQCLVVSACLGNPSGMYKALSLRLQGIDSPVLSSKTLAKVFDSFPLNLRGFNREKVASPYLWIVNDAIIADSARDTTIFSHLRKYFDPLRNVNLYHRYLSALGRCRRIDLLLHEWETVISPILKDENFENPHSREIFTFILDAFKTANSPESSFAILDSVLHTSTVSESGHRFALDVLVDLISQELLPFSKALSHIVRWLINNKTAAFWSDTDVARIFDGVSTSVPEAAVSRNNSKEETISIVGQLLSELVIQVRQGEDVELTLKHLEHTFGQN